MSKKNQTPVAYYVLDRIGFGATPADVSAFNSLGSTDLERLLAYVDQQLDYLNIDDTSLNSRLSANNFKTLKMPLITQWATYQNDPDINKLEPTKEVQCATFNRAIYSKRQLYERMVGFWHDHFNVCGMEGRPRSVYVDYDSNIRANALGNFRTMLEAIAKSTAMLFFLDNGANGVATTRTALPAINENYGRELMELHTLGVENYFGEAEQSTIPMCAPPYSGIASGYCESDVIAVAQAFSGWGVHDGTHGDTINNGTFFYRDGSDQVNNKWSWHVSGDKLAFGNVYNSGVDLQEGQQVLDWLAYHPNTATHICEKLCRRFVSDTPPPALVQRAADAFLAEKDNPLQLQQVMLTILTSPEFRKSRGQKIKRPLNWGVSAARATGFNTTVKYFANSAFKSDELDTVGSSFRGKLSDTGDMPHEWATPEGPPDITLPWVGTTGMVYTMKFNTWLTDDVDNDGNPLLPIYDITTDSPARGGLGGSSQTAQAIADFWWTRLIGYLPLEYDCYATALSFLAQQKDPATYVFNWSDDVQHSTGKNPDPSEDWNKTRLRSAVAMMLNSRAFMVQG